MSTKRYSLTETDVAALDAAGLRMYTLGETADTPEDVIEREAKNGARLVLHRNEVGAHLIDLDAPGTAEFIGVLWDRALDGTDLDRIWAEARGEDRASWGEALVRAHCATVS